MDETNEKSASVSTGAGGLNDDDLANDATAIPRDVLGDVYTALAARRTAFDTLMWQIPTIGLTAQAFLLTIALGAGSSRWARMVAGSLALVTALVAIQTMANALGAGSSRWARMVAGSLALVTALVAIQTMAKHRVNERTDSLILERVEKTFGIRNCSGVWVVLWAGVDCLGGCGIALP